jgi:hypothetical protein
MPPFSAAGGGRKWRGILPRTHDADDWPSLANTGTAFENAISECLHFPPLEAAEHGGASCPARTMPMIGHP